MKTYDEVNKAGLEIMHMLKDNEFNIDEARSLLKNCSKILELAQFTGFGDIGEDELCFYEPYTQRGNS